jgi:hypothetical protein
MRILRRVLYLDALLSALLGLALAMAPGFAIVTVLGQPAAPDWALVRILGISLFTVALLMVLVAQRVEELWWWSWAFVIQGVGVAVVSTLHPLFGLPQGAASWPWWLLAAVVWALVLGYLWGLARAGIERPVT